MNQLTEKNQAEAVGVVKKQRPWQNVSVVTPTRVEAVPAGFGVRLEAALIDYMLCLLGVLAAVWVGWLTTGHMSLAALSRAVLGGAGLVFFVNHLALSLLTGQTVGKMAFAIRVVRADGRPLEWSRVLGRHTLGYFLSAGPFGLGFLWALWDSEKQAWHDKIFSTYVVRVE